LIATPTDVVLAQGERTHIDFIPRYRNKSPNMLISRVDYYSAKTIFHIIYVAESKDSVFFYGKQHPRAWVVQSSGGARPDASTTIQKTGEVCNIRINDQMKASWLPANQGMSYNPEKGDIISCEIHIEKMPHFVKVVNISGGDAKLAGGATELLCSDLMLKTAESGTLGNLEQMTTIVSNHYKSFDYVKHPEIKSISSVVNEKLTKEDEETVPLAAASALEPVNYTPKTLETVTDLKCKERVILKNVYFSDNTAEFSKRTLALKTIEVIYSYMKQYPESKIVLHGHTDVFGNPHENLELSKERVLTVKRVLTQKGIDKHNVIAVFHGGEQPLPNCEKGSDLNRRVEVEIVCEDRKASPKDK